MLVQLVSPIFANKTLQFIAGQINTWGADEFLIVFIKLGIDRRMFRSFWGMDIGTAVCKYGNVGRVKRCEVLYVF